MAKITSRSCLAGRDCSRPPCFFDGIRCLRSTSFAALAPAPPQKAAHARMHEPGGSLAVKTVRVKIGKMLEPQLFSAG